MEILLVIQVIVVVALVAVILVQKSSSDGFTGGSSPNSFLTGRASANLFTRTTSILATIFIVNSLVLAYIASHTERAGDVLEQAADEVSKDKSADTDKKSSDGLSDLQEKLDSNLRAQPAEEKAPEAPTTPAAPAVPVSE